MSGHESDGAHAWGHQLALDETSDPRPKFVQIVDAVTADIRAGVLAPGARLPGTHTLAIRLGVHRNTVLAAMRELDTEMDKKLLVLMTAMTLLSFKTMS